MRYSIRTLLVLITGIAITLAVWRWYSMWGVRDIKGVMSQPTVYFMLRVWPDGRFSLYKRNSHSYVYPDTKSRAIVDAVMFNGDGKLDGFEHQVFMILLDRNH